MLRKGKEAEKTIKALREEAEKLRARADVSHACLLKTQGDLESARRQAEVQLADQLTGARIEHQVRSKPLGRSSGQSAGCYATRAHVMYVIVGAEAAVGLNDEESFTAQQWSVTRGSGFKANRWI